MARNLYLLAKKVDSLESMLDFMKELKSDFDDEGVEWGNSDLELYLEGIHGAIYGYIGLYVNNGDDPPKDISWGFLARIMASATEHG